MNKHKILFAVLALFTLSIGGCKDCGKDNVDPTCSGAYVYRDGKCQCPENNVDLSHSEDGYLVTACQPMIEQSYWIQTGDSCLGDKISIYLGETGQDIMDQNTKLIDLGGSLPGAKTGCGINTQCPISNRTGKWVIENKYNFFDKTSQCQAFSKCFEHDYDQWDMEIVMSEDWKEATVTYTFYYQPTEVIAIRDKADRVITATFRNDRQPRTE